MLLYEVGQESGMKLCGQYLHMLYVVCVSYVGW